MVDFVRPPAGAHIGERVMCAGYDGSPDDVVSSKKLPKILSVCISSFVLF